MNTKIVYTSVFEKGYKRLYKRYKSLPDDLKTLIAGLRDNPTMGVLLKYNLRKVRMAISSKSKGKSGGARVITHTVLLAETAAEVVLVTIYDKSDMDNMTDKELLDIVKQCGLNT